MRNFKVGDIVLLQEEMSRKKWPMHRVIAIQEGNDGFVQSVNIVVGTNASKMFSGHKYLSDCEQTCVTSGKQG